MGSMEESKFGYAPKSADTNVIENAPTMTLEEVESEITKYVEELEAIEGNEEAKEKMIGITKKLGELIKQVRAYDKKAKESSLN